MFTRKDYMDGKCIHRQYYAQFVTNYIKDTVLNKFGIEKLVKSFNEDKYFNNISLSTWDRINYCVDTNPTLDLLKSLGEGYSLAGAVCILKEAAQQLVEEYKNSGDNK